MTNNLRITELERQNTDLQKNNTDLVLKNRKLKSLAYHKGGVSYQAMFTASLNMLDDVEITRDKTSQVEIPSPADTQTGD